MKFEREKPLDADMRTMSGVLMTLCGLLAVYRLFLIAQALSDGSDETTDYAIRQLVYTFTWGMMANVFYYQYKEQKTNQYQHKRMMNKTMERITLVALCGSIANTIALVVYYFQTLNDQSGLVVVHNIAEAIVWIFISMYLATFYFWHREVRREIRKQKEEKLKRDMGLE